MEIISPVKNLTQVKKGKKYKIILNIDGKEINDNYTCTDHLFDSSRKRYYYIFNNKEGKQFKMNRDSVQKKIDSQEIKFVG